MDVKTLDKLVYEQRINSPITPTLMELNPTDWAEILNANRSLFVKVVNIQLVDRYMGLRVHTADDLNPGDVNFYYSENHA